MEAVSAPIHHPDDELLFGYATGSVTGAKALIVATHLAFCPICRRQVASVEAVGGELLDQEAGAPSQEPPAGLPPLALPVSAAPAKAEGFEFAPLHLRSILAEQRPKWIDVWFGVKEMPIQDFGPEARLLWIPRDRRMPRHDHFGEEMTLVLSGSFSDATGRFVRGDFQTGAPGFEHQPKAGSEGPCICLVVESDGLKLSGLLGRLVDWRGGRGLRKRTAA